MKKLLLFPLWFVLTIITYLLSFNLLIGVSRTKNLNTLVNFTFREMAPKNLYQVYSSLPQTVESFQTAINTSDARPEIIRQYLQKFHSPLEPYSQEILAASETYSTKETPDIWRHIVAIAQCESNLGHKIPEDSHNAWGLGIPTGASSGMAFSGWTEGINAEAKFLRNLIDRGLYTPEEWGPIYAPPSALNGGSWAKCVREFLPDLE